MSIVIRGMEMPTKLDPDNYIELACGMDGKQYARLYNIYYGGLGGWHEVISVTEPHGDLIDIDEYRDKFMNDVYALCSDDPDNYRANAIIDLFDEAPTIIPAEPPKEET